MFCRNTIDWPKSPWMTFPSHWTYRTRNGLSNPYSALIAAIVSAAGAGARP